MTSTLSRTSFCYKVRAALRLPFKVAILNQDSLSFNITEIAQPLAKCFDLRSPSENLQSQILSGVFLLAAAPQRGC